MKRTFQIIIVLSILLFNTILIFGQEKLIEKNQYSETIDKGYEHLKEKPFRAVFTSEFFNDRNSTSTVMWKSIREFVPPDRHRWLNERDGEKKETIEIGPREYYKINNGEWKEGREPISGGIGSGVGSASVEYESYKLYENVKLDGKKVNLYEMVKRLTEFSTRNDGDEIWTRKTWIGKYGLIIKVQEEYETVGKKSFRRQTTIYEYDSKIKIEAPKMSLKKS